jgi:protocatechuate 3,4-dioxygenase alpha subunit
MMLEQTPSQTVGPFFHFGLISGNGNVLVNDHTVGQRLRLVGAVLDGNSQPVPDALVEIWQADAHGYFNHPADPNQSQADPNFRGFGRADTVDGGRYWFETIKPGRVPGRDGKLQAPHINVRVFARGMLIHALTRLYFADESANATDAVLNAIPDPNWRQTLLATRQDIGGRCTYRFDIRLQGEQQTVFFEY